MNNRCKNINMDTNNILLSSYSITHGLRTIAIFLVLASISGQLSKFLVGNNSPIVKLFDLNREENIPSFFSELILLIATLLLLLITIIKRAQKDRNISKWAILSSGFLFMAFDEAFQIHERFVLPVRKLLGDGQLGIFYYAWVIPGITIVLFFSLFFLRFLLHLPAKTRRDFLISATIYLSGCVGFELIGGLYDELYGVNNLTSNMISTVEESLEITGIISFIRALLVYITDNYDEVRLRFQ